MISRHEKNQIRRNSRKARLQSKSSSESLSTVSCINKRDKRFKSYFEPIFNPTDEWPFSEAPWRILGDKRNYHSVLTARNLLVQLANFDREVIQSASFESCDFDGDFSQSSPSFKKCVFDKCDFGLSSWRRARFKGCTFIRTSFSLSTFVDCEFRDCKFIEIGFSGNETILDGTLFTNPTEFISNVYLNEDPEILRKNGTSLSYQSMRLDGTKVSISRTLLANLAVSGEEKSYYAILKFNQRQSLIAKMSNNRYELASKPGLDKEIQLV
ncbi:pentapeptide repeat-containing protein [Methylobacterium sp. Leaf113]|uniref:pentapeptide repeat-containing protein n=1 Tax=Methylobacterium sp. Leaf113 TaxID=1736259 RepID=UPI000ADEDAA8|nr:pentapeptide repeat-containing protein [Methylobacterium sp. Leaf113]